MGTLSITKVAFGCSSIGYLRERIAARAVDGVHQITTRYRPTRHAQLIGGSLYWIIKHRLVARQTILGFVEIEAEKRWIVQLEARLVPVRARAKRAHQGWRYLEAGNAPADFDGGDADLAELPPGMLGELAALALI